MDETRRQRTARNTSWQVQPIWFAYLGLIGLLGTLHPRLASLRVLALCGLVYLALLAWGWLRRLLAPAPVVERPTELPLPGPAAQRGLRWMLSRLTLSSLLTNLNPLQLTQFMLHLGGQLIAAQRWSGRAQEHEAYRSPVVYTLPVQGTWHVFKGGPTQETSHSWDVLNQRHAYDLVIANEGGERHAPGAGGNVEDYFCYGQPVVAPADGVVVRVRDGIRDAPAPGTGWIDWLSPDFRGNFVVIRHAPREYSVLAHLVPGQIAVSEGQTVARGELVGRCGNSGHSTEPHLHMHLQDHSNFYLAMGLPWRFAEVSVGEGTSQELVIIGGMRVRTGSERPLHGNEQRARTGQGASQKIPALQEDR